MSHSRHSSLASLDVIIPLCVENNTIFTQMLENKRPFVVVVVVFGGGGGVA